MDLDLVITIGGAALGLAIAVIGFLLVRAINAVDSSVASLNAKVDVLNAKDTQVEIRLAELSVRVLRVEADLAQMIMSKERAG